MDLFLAGAFTWSKGDSARQRGEPHGGNTTHTVTVAPPTSADRRALPDGRGLIHTQPHPRLRLTLLDCRRVAELAWLILGCPLARLFLSLLLDPTLSKPALTGELRERCLP